MFEKASYKDQEEKKSWRKTMKIEFVSSDESGCDEGVDVIITKPLPWLSETVTVFKQALDLAAFQERTPLARRQTKERRLGAPSSRPKPNGDYPTRVFNE